MAEKGEEEKKEAVEFIVECMHCKTEISRRIVYWPKSQVDRFGNKAVSSGICDSCQKKGKTILKD